MDETWILLALLAVMLYGVAQVATKVSLGRIPASGFISLSIVVSTPICIVCLSPYIASGELFEVDPIVMIVALAAAEKEDFKVYRTGLLKIIKKKRILIVPLYIHETKKGIYCMHKPSHINCFLPPDMLKNIATNGTENQKNQAIDTLKISAQMRGQRQALADFQAATLRFAVGGKERIVYDAKNGSSLPGTIARRENDPPSADVAVNEAFDGSGITYDLYSNVYQRNSIDNNDMRLDSTVHYQIGYDNAFWNGEQMVYGDGDEASAGERAPVQPVHHCD